MIKREQYFYFSDGSSTKSIEELKEKIESLSYEEFYNHVNENKNDFASWVEGVFNEKSLSDKLRKVTSIVETVELIEEFLNPKESQENMDKLGDEDFQKLIEDALFGDLDEPEPPKEALTKEAQKDVESSMKDFEKSDDNDNNNDNNDSKKNKSDVVTKEELQSLTDKVKETPEKKPGEPILSKDKDKHIPITKTKAGEESLKMKEMKKHYHSFLVKETLWGFILGLIMGFVLGRIISFFI